MNITIYQKPTCSTCRQVYNILKESGVDFKVVNYYTEPLTETKIRSLLKKMKMTPLELLRTKENIYKELHLEDEHFTDDELIQYMITNPELLQRPIAEKGAIAILARPAERIKEIL